MSTESFNVRLQRVRELSASTRDFQFIREDGQNLDYLPGQFYRFVFTDEAGEFERSYSLCNFETLYGSALDLVISKVDGGRATRLLFDCEAGLTARVTGPFGRLTLPKETPGRLVMVATSVGLAPYMPILRQLEQLDYPSVILLLGVRDRTEFIYGDWLREYESANDYFELRLCLSRETAAADYEFNGYVTGQLPSLTPDAGNDHFLLCGNPAMVEDAWGYLKGSGIQSRQVIREKYVFAKEKKQAAAALSDAQKKLIAEKMKKYS